MLYIQFSNLFFFSFVQHSWTWILRWRKSNSFKWIAIIVFTTGWEWIVEEKKHQPNQKPHSIDHILTLMLEKCQRVEERKETKSEQTTDTLKIWIQYTSIFPKPYAPARTSHFSVILLNRCESLAFWRTTQRRKWRRRRKKRYRIGFELFTLVSVLRYAFWCALF